MPEDRPRNPYDFVPLEGKPRRGGFLQENTQEAVKAGLHSGRLICHLTTETPLYIHGEGAQQARGERPFYRIGGQICIPAPALKGMVRSVAETVTDGCLSTKAAESPQVPDGYQACSLIDTCCPTCALFGMVERRHNGDEQQATPLAGRVDFGQARPIRGAQVTRVLMPQMRGGPKPSHSSFYFDSQTGEVLGRKFYYHHGYRYRDSLQMAFDNLRNPKNPDPDSMILEAVETVNEGSFAFEIRFENLTDHELGVLVYSLVLEEDLRHHLGFAKPYGLGTVRIEIETFEFDAFEDLPERGQVPARFLSYEPPSAVASGEASHWQVQGLSDWKARPGHATAYARFKEILHWPRHEAFAYPHFHWFKEQRKATVQVTLDQYQGRNPAPTPPKPEPVSPAEPGERSDPGRHRGRVRWFNEAKGYGFIQIEGGGDVFVHHSGIRQTGFRTLEDGDLVEFDVEEMPKGPQAVNVTRLEGR